MKTDIDHIEPIPRPVFFQDWWLNTVANDHWHREAFTFKSVIDAEWIFIKNKNWGFDYHIPPLYTPYSGLYFSHRYIDPQKQIPAETKIIDAILKKVPDKGLMEVKLHPSFQNWYPFYKLGFKENTRYTYYLFPSDEETLIMNLKPSLRNLIRNQYLSIPIHDDPSEADLILLGNKHFFNKKIQKFWDEEIFANIIREGKVNGQIKTFGIYYKSSLISAIMLLEDDAYVYNIFNLSSELSNKNDMSFLIWKSILYASTQNKTFDFEGSMIPGVEKFYRGFGGELIPYHQISKVNGIIPKLYLALK